MTQVDQVGIHLNDLKKVGLDVGKAVPVAFKEIQPALYDIFSSMDVNLPQAQNMLTNFAKAAVAGNTAAASREACGRPAVSETAPTFESAL